jgi:hypothetical protein
MAKFVRAYCTDLESRVLRFEEDFVAVEAEEGFGCVLAGCNERSELKRLAVSTREMDECTDFGVEEDSRPARMKAGELGEVKDSAVDYDPLLYLIHSP